jgi:DNA-binding CsgD family transcriptional regulator
LIETVWGERPPTDLPHDHQVTRGEAMNQPVLRIALTTVDRVVGEALAEACERRGVVVNLIAAPTVLSKGRSVLSTTTREAPTRAAGADADWPAVVSSPVTVHLGDRHSNHFDGVSGWPLPLDIELDELVGALRSAAVASPSSTRPPSGDRPSPLTEREREIIDAMLTEVSTKGIASQLGISTHTVRSHLSSIMAKIGVSSRAELGAWALRSGSSSIVDSSR